MVRTAVPIAERPSQQKNGDGLDFGRAVDSAQANQQSADMRQGAAQAARTVQAGSTAQQNQELDVLPGEMLYPWQLLAQTTMSQRGVHPYGGPIAGGWHDGDSTRDTTGGILPAVVEVTGDLVSLARWGGSIGVTASCVGILSSGSSSEFTRASTTLPSGGGQALAALSRWAERLQRRVEDEHGRATVWLRDYQQDAEALTSSIDEIIAFYGPEQPVWRIVANGSEIWRRPSISSEEA
ncbi:MAG TPA: hypothetical protein DEO93_06845 [Stenotrophomonas sp.]|nr:hypothetical protein [Stenotrophomonas sp.]